MLYRCCAAAGKGSRSAIAETAPSANLPRVLMAGKMLLEVIEAPEKPSLQYALPVYPLKRTLNRNEDLLHVLWGMLIGSGREADHHDGSAAQLASDVDGSPDSRDDGLADGQAKSGPSGLAAARWIAAVETVEDVG